MKIDSNDIANAKDISLLQSLICSICISIPTNPVFCHECDNIFCPDCSANFKTCPLCRKSFVSSPCDKKSIIMEQINEIRMKCKYNQQGCNELLSIDKKEYHESKCDYRTKKCDKCHKQVVIFQIEKHLFEDCDMNKVQCFLCGNSFSIGKLTAHLKECKDITEKIIKKIDKCDKCKKLKFSSEYHQCVFKDDNYYYNKMIAEMKLLMQEKVKDNKKKIKELYKKAYNIMKKTKQSYERVIMNLDKEIESKKNSLSQIKQMRISKIKKCIDFYKKDTLKIEKSIVIKEHEFNDIKNLLFSFQPLLINQITNNVSLSQSEIDLRSHIIDFNLPNNIEESISSIKVVPKEPINIIQKVKGICQICLKESDSIHKCNNCNKNLCSCCQSKCNNELSSENYYCSNCFSQCSICGRRSCNKCIKHCFNPQCKNLFCPSCYNKNQHQERAKGDECHIFRCELCDKEDICIMQTVNHIDTRMCLDCYKIVLESETTSQQ